MITFHPFRLDPRDGSLWRNDQRVRLTHKAASLLGCLLDQAGRVVSRQRILDTVWPDSHVHPDNVKVLVGEIRRALGDDSSRPRFIRSVVRRGYTFIGPVDTAPTGDVPVPLLAGRSTEMAALADALDAATRFERRVLFVTGAGGCGKTALCEAFLQVAARRTGVLLGVVRCKENADAEPLAQLQAALAQLSNSSAGELVARTLDLHAPSWLSKLAVLEGQSRPMGPTAGSGRMLRELVSAFETLAEKATLVLWIDDVHLARPETIDLITALGHRRDPARMLLIATGRYATDIGDPVAFARLRTDLVARGRAGELALSQLTAAV